MPTDLLASFSHPPPSSPLHAEQMCGENHGQMALAYDFQSDVRITDNDRAFPLH